MALVRQQQPQQQIQRGARAVLMRLTFGNAAFLTCTAIGHLPGPPGLHGTKGNVR